MSKTKAKWIHFDVNSLESDGDNLRVKVVGAGAIERTANGLDVKTSGITDAMLAGSISFSKLADSANIARLDQNETIVGLWNFPTGANVPTINAKEIATKEYVDSIASGLDPKDSCRALSSAEIGTLSALPANMDGVIDLVANDRVLLINEVTNPENNGIWLVQTGAWTRPADFATGSSASGAFTFITEGTTYEGSGWVCQSDTGSAIIGTDALTFVQFSDAGTIDAGAGLTKTGNTIAVVPAKLTKGGDAELDGDILAITYTPSNYTRALSGGQTTNLDELTSHLKGIDNAFAALAADVAEQFTLAAGDITNKYVDLANTPNAAGNVHLVVQSAPGQSYGDDYQMDGVTTNRLTWAALGLDGELTAGDKLTVFYAY